MDAMTLMILMGIVGGAMAIGAPLVLISLASFIYIWTHMYPWLKMVGKWGAKPANFVAMLALFFICLVIILVLTFLVHPIFLIFILPALIILFPVGLAVIVWIVRVIKWIFGNRCL